MSAVLTVLTQHLALHSKVVAAALTFDLLMQVQVEAHFNYAVSQSSLQSSMHYRLPSLSRQFTKSRRCGGWVLARPGPACRTWRLRAAAGRATGWICVLCRRVRCPRRSRSLRARGSTRRVTA
ncbi:hypothetical protein PR003_g13732 [Phytophthora rubi]|uniref:Uncharacterized protein n=1 Tax=Phytophthora rubi TaxID=129364 RepID=A0A6A4F5V7_9STRA|nr:hypothetical protein PR003_g13732 [Phytophthora rubi]